MSLSASSLALSTTASPIVLQPGAGMAVEVRVEDRSSYSFSLPPDQVCWIGAAKKLGKKTTRSLELPLSASLLRRPMHPSALHLRTEWFNLGTARALLCLGVRIAQMAQLGLQRLCLDSLLVSRVEATCCVAAAFSIS